jgi:hypothetical protein
MFLFHHGTIAPLDTMTFKIIDDRKKKFFQCVIKSISRIVRHLWLTPIILTTWEAEIQRVMVQG